jgi:hypothetical protein
MKGAKEMLLSEIDRVAAAVPLGSHFKNFHTFRVEGTACTYRIYNDRGALARFKKQVKSCILKNPVKVKKFKPKKWRLPKTNPATLPRASGVAHYGDFWPRKKPVYEAAGQTMTEDIFFADKYGLVVGSDFKPKKPVNDGGIYWNESIKGHSDSPPYDVMLATFDGEVSKADIIGEVTFPKYDNGPPCIHVMTDSGLEFFYETKYVDPILTMYPEAEITVNISNSRAIFIQGGVRVGVVVNFDDKITTLPAEVRPLYEELHPVKLPDRAVGF